MKKFINSITMAALCALPVFVGCDSGFSTREIVITEEVPLMEGREEALSLAISMEVPETGSGALDRMTEGLVAAVFGEEYSTMTADAAAQAYRDDVVAEYHAENQAFAEMEDIGPSALNWGEDVSAHVTRVKDNIVSYMVVRYSYRGGAHGMVMENAYNFNLKTGERLMEEDFFKEGSEAELSALLQKHLPEAFEDPAYMEGLFVTEIQPNGNFGLSEAGVTYIYNRYEIGPYALGSVHVTIPWAEVSGLLK